jgi:hypothetical protein
MSLTPLSLSQATFADLLTAKRQLIVGLAMVTFQQVTGQPSVLYYTNSLLEDTLGDSNRETAGAACLVTSVKLMATVVSVMLVDKVSFFFLLLHYSILVDGTSCTDEKILFACLLVCLFSFFLLVYSTHPFSLDERSFY